MQSIHTYKFVQLAIGSVYMISFSVFQKETLQQVCTARSEPLSRDAEAIAPLPQDSKFGRNDTGGSKYLLAIRN